MDLKKFFLRVSEFWYSKQSYSSSMLPGKETFMNRNLSRSTKIPSIYRKISLTWKNHLAMITETLSCIWSQYLWDSANIQVDEKTFSRFFEKNIHYVTNF